MNHGQVAREVICELKDYQSKIKVDMNVDKKGSGILKLNYNMQVKQHWC